MKIGDLINSLAVKCGKQNDPAVIDILSRADLQNADLADEVANAINNGLMTVDGAKNNPAIKAHFKAETLSGVDKETLSFAENLGLDDDFKTKIAETGNSFERIRLLSGKVKETIDGLRAAKGNGDEKKIAEYIRQINELNAEKAKLKETTVPKSELDKLREESENGMRDFMLRSKIAGLKFANPNVSHEDNVTFAGVILNNRLAKNKAVVVKEGDELHLRNAEDPKLVYYDEQQKPVSFDDFMNKTFADSKILAVSGPQNPNNPVAPQQNPVIQQEGQFNTSRFDAAFAASTGAE